MRIWRYWEGASIERIIKDVVADIVERGSRATLIKALETTKRNISPGEW